MFNFDEKIDRRSTVCKKWNPQLLNELFGNSDALPMWIADMDFKVAPVITEAIQEVVDHGIYGYSNADSSVKSFINWGRKHHHWAIEEEWVFNTPGVVTALNLAIQTYSQPGDRILIQQPVYYPFSLIIEKNQREIAKNQLIIQGDSIAIDFEDFENKAKDPKTSMFILCSPHNPLGHLYTKEELIRLLDICFANDVVVVADEIHADLIMPGNTFTSIGQLGRDYSDRVIITQAPSKTFNLAGLQWSAVVIADETLRKAYQETIDKLDLAMQNPLTIAAVSAAYDHGDDWLESVIAYIYDNYLYLKETLNKALPQATVFDLKATYLAFVDFSYLNLDDDALDELFAKEIGIALDSGHWFGDGGSGYMRINLATPRANIETAVARIIEALKDK